MKRPRTWAVVSFLALLFVAPAFERAEGPVVARLSAPSAPMPGRDFGLEVILDIDPGWHVYGPSPGDTGLPTTVAWDLPPGYAASPLVWPALQRFSLLGVDSEGYAGRLVLKSRVSVPASARIGEQVELKAKVEWLACRVECTPGGSELELSLTIGEALPRALESSVFPSLPLALALALAFLGGLLLNLMPCVLPVLSLKALAIVRSSQGGQGPKSLVQALAFATGVLFSFLILALLLLVLRAGGQALGWGFQFQSPTFVAIAATVFFLMGLNLFGLFELGLSLTRLGRARGRAGSVFSSFLGGLLVTAVATPCTAPFMGLAVGYALSHDAAAAFGVFAALGLGLAAPLLALSAFPGLVDRVPKGGPWMERFRQVLGFPMMATVLWLVFVLGKLGGEEAVLSLLEAFLAAALGAWIWGVWGGLERARGVRLVAAVASLALVLGGGLWAVRGSRAAPESPRGPSSLGLPSLTRSGASSFWQPWSEAALSELRAKGRPVFVDFTAAWCLSCQVNEALALDDRALRARFDELGVVALKADWTARDEAITQALAALGRASVPLYALYLPGQSAPVLLPEILTPTIVLRYLDGSLKP